MKSSHILQIPKFSKHAQELRQEFDRRFADPAIAHAGRFVWDYWHLPGAYTHLRTPAFQYFEQKLYMKLHRELIAWGRRELGCWDISPPWMSCYIEGCKQELHADVPHGPWAFVFSLSPQKSKFTGGQTLIMKPETLNYWHNFREHSGWELPHFVDRITTPFNQLTIFDPRYPHGVTEVHGTQDPREGRLVIHGWFTEPKTYIDGFLPSKRTEKILDGAFGNVQDLVAQNIHSGNDLQGVLSLQLEVGKTGHVRKFRFATCNLLDQSGEQPREILKKIAKIYQELEFSSAKGATTITVPIIVQ